MEYLSLFILALSPIFFILTLIFYRKDMRIEWDHYTNFLSFMVLISCIRVGIASLFPLNIATGIDIKPFMFFWVFLEDAGFVLPIFWLSKCKWGDRNSESYKKWFKCISLPVIIGLSLTFGYGHLYQGLLCACLATAYPFLISYRWGLKWGFGTVMLCHVSYDMISYIIIKLIPFILF